MIRPGAWVSRFALLAAGMMLASCGGGQSSPAGDVVAPLPVDSELAEPREITVERAIAEIETVEVPAGVDQTAWSELTSGLVEVLEQRQTAKIVSQPPTGDRNVIRDIGLAKAGSDYALSWSYLNVATTIKTAK